MISDLIFTMPRCNVILSVNDGQGNHTRRDGRGSRASLGAIGSNSPRLPSLAPRTWGAHIGMSAKTIAAPRLCELQDRIKKSDLIP